MTEREQRLLSLLAKTSYHYSPTPVFQLASGKMSRFYIDCKTTTLTPEGLVLVGEVIFERVKHLPIQGVGGLEFGAIPLALATSICAFNSGMNIKPFVVRKQTKERGLKKSIEGQLSQGDRVVLLEDVITTGGSSIQAVERIREAKIEIDHILAIVDRGNGGEDAIIKAGLKLEAIFKLEDIQNAISNR